jgi:hypothetical protein
MISNKYKTIFVHINKCGGTSVEHLFGEPLKVHETLQDILVKIKPEKFNDYFKFTFVRNPWDRTYSVYHNRPKKGILSDSFFGKNLVSFEEYIIGHNRIYEQRGNWEGFRFIGPQLPWIKINNSVVIDYIAKFEDYQNELNKIVKTRIHPEKQIVHLNYSNHKHYSSYYNSKLVDIVANWCKEDIEYFSYKFEDKKSNFKPI